MEGEVLADEKKARPITEGATRRVGRRKPEYTVATSPVQPGDPGDPLTHPQLGETFLARVTRAPTSYIRVDEANGVP